MHFDVPHGGGGKPEPIDFSRLCEEDYFVAAMLPIFATAMAPFAGQMVNPQVWVMAGMRHVFDWWCKTGLGCGEPDMVDAAADAAYHIAMHVYPEDDTLGAAIDALFPYMMEKWESCTGRQTATLSAHARP